METSWRPRRRMKMIYAGIVLRRRRCLRKWVILLPLVYLIGLFLCARPLSLLFFFPVPPGSLYRSHQIFLNLRLHILSDPSPPLQLSTVWKYKKLKIEKPCKISNVAARMETSQNTGYLIVEANGGLNQQRSSICNAVTVVGFLNATLVIPRLEFHNVWQDPMCFILSYFFIFIFMFMALVLALPVALSSFALH